MNNGIGLTTTEFYTMVVAVIGAIFAALSKLNPWVQAVAIIGAVVIACFYIWSRTEIKTK